MKLKQTVIARSVATKQSVRLSQRLLHYVRPKAAPACRLPAGEAGTGRHHVRNDGDCNGFTLIELLIALAISAVIAGSVYFALSTSLESWELSRNRLCVQKVLSETIQRITEGGPGMSGLRDCMEIVEAREDRIDFIPPWTDDTHTAESKDFIYTLNRRLKDGTAAPIGEFRQAGAREWNFVSTSLIDSENTDVTRVRTSLLVPSGSDLRFTYHPDPAGAEVAHSFYWDPEAKEVFENDGGEVRSVSRNAFGVQITGFGFKYFDPTNQPIEDGRSVNDNHLISISGIEVRIEAQLGDHKESQLCFVSLRNVPRRTGYFALREDMEIPLPDSEKIHTLLLTNLTGIGSGDELDLEIQPASGKAWRVKIVFERPGLAKPRIKMYAVEYPPQTTVLTDYANSSVDVGLSLLSLGDGRYDYDDDDQIDDVVLFKEAATLKVTKMDIKGAGLFVRQMD